VDTNWFASFFSQLGRASWSTRELAIAIVMTGIVVVAVLLRRKAAIGLGRSLLVLFSPWILSYFAIITTLSLSIAFCLEYVAIWTTQSAKSIVLWTVFSGIPIGLKTEQSRNSNTANTTFGYRTVAMTGLGVGIIIAFVIDTFTFDLWFEILWIGAFFIVSLLMVAVTKSTEQLQRLGIAITFLLACNAAIHLLFLGQSIDLKSTALELLTMAIYTVAYIPVIALWYKSIAFIELHNAIRRGLRKNGFRKSYISTFIKVSRAFKFDEKSMRAFRVRNV